jgi:hypothetical protein
MIAMSSRRPVDRRTFAAAALGLLLSACHGAPAADAGTIVIGVTSDFTPGPDIGRLEGTLAIGGGSPERRIWAIDGAEPLVFPLELACEDLPDGTEVDVRWSAFETAYGTTDTPFFTRRAIASVVAGSELLVRTHLEWECVPSYNLGGERIAPTCAEPETCVAAECTDPHVPAQELEPYSPSWAVAFADECRPLDAGPPEVAIGSGISTYSLLAPGGPVAMELGSQGGYHVWLALRMKNLHRAGSTTTLTATRPATAEELCAIEVPWDFTPAESGSCDLTGIRCIVSYDINGAVALQGEQIHVEAKVVDATGNVGFGEQDITLTTSQ